MIHDIKTMGKKDRCMLISHLHARSACCIHAHHIHKLSMEKLKQSSQFGDNLVRSSQFQELPRTPIMGQFFTSWSEISMAPAVLKALTWPNPINSIEADLRVC